MQPLAAPLIAAMLVAALAACGGRTPLNGPAVRDDGVGDGGPEPVDRPVLERCDGTPEGTTRPCRSACGDGVETCLGGAWRDCTAPQPLAPEPTLVLSGTLRDFLDSHPDFEAEIADDRGIVEPQLGPDKKPVYAGRPRTPSTHGREAFDQWFRDVPGVNQSLPYELSLARVGDGDGDGDRDGDTYRLHDPEFFPLDGLLFGNQGRAHNFHFTLELHGRFLYRGGERLTFGGDDDLWVFIGGRLALDLGGVHGHQSVTLDLDLVRDELGLEPGRVYDLDIFFAERHTSGSTLHVETTDADFVRCP